MKAIVTAVADDGAKWGWPGEPVFRFRGEDGSWAWIPQPKGVLYFVGDVFDEEGGYEWLPANEQKQKIAALERKTDAQRRIDLVRRAERDDKLDLSGNKKTAAQLDREINQVIGVTVRRRKK